MSAIIVRRTTRDIVVRREQRSIVIRRSGIQGPPGGGAGGVTPFDYVQASAALTWTINHNFGRNPVSVRVMTAGGVEVEAEVIDTSINQTVVLFKTPQAGRVRII